MYQRFDMLKRGWITSPEVLVMLTSCVTGLHRLIRFLPPSIRLLHEFVSTNEPRDGQWTSEILYNSIMKDSYAKSYCLAISDTTAIEDIRKRAKKIWQAFEGSMAFQRKKRGTKILKSSKKNANLKWFNL